MWDASSDPVTAVTCIVAGAVAVLLALADIFYTVLLPASGRGPVRRPLARGVRWLFRQTRHLPAGTRRRVLPYAGPLEVGATLLSWFVLLLVGWALIYLPALGGAVTAATGTTDRSWWTALYFSGYNLTTLGLGDLVATSPSYRMLVVGEAATGFMSFTMAISYFISVYGTLTGRNAFALALHERSGGTGRGAPVVQALWDEGPVAAAINLAAMAASLRDVVQTHSSYPVLRSFHYQHEYDALPRILLTCWETVTLLRTAVDVDDRGRPELAGSALAEIEASAAVLTGRSAGLADPGPALPPDRREDWRRHHTETLAELTAAGVPVRADSADAYLRARAAWDMSLGRLAQELLYDWPDGLDPAPRPAGRSGG
ncbi:MAG TPA: potassium channel family protein [Nocardioides sp.]|nr:potassium channel family protein [Nocardioides sp.]